MPWTATFSRETPARSHFRNHQLPATAELHLLSSSLTWTAGGYGPLLHGRASPVACPQSSSCSSNVLLSKMGRQADTSRSWLQSARFIRESRSSQLPWPVPTARGRAHCDPSDASLSYLPKLTGSYASCRQCSSQIQSSQR